MDRKTREKLPELDEDAKSELRNIVEYIVFELCDQIDDAWQFDEYDKREVLMIARKALLREIDREIAKLENNI